MELPLAHLGGPFESAATAALLAIAAVSYRRRAAALARSGHPVPPGRQLSFLAGLALVAAAVLTPLAGLGEERLSAHMVQHLLLGDLAALLIVAGLTGPILRPLLAHPLLRRLEPLAHPLVALPLWVANLYLWHLPALYQSAQGGSPLHGLEHACFLGFGILMWMSLLGPLPRPAWFTGAGEVAYVLAVRVAGAGLANVLLFSGTVLYPRYAGSDGAAGVAPLADQQLAGGIMLAEASLVTLGLLAWIVVRAVRRWEEAQGLIDLAAARGLALSPERARRAVRGGWGGALRRRIAATGAANRPGGPRGDTAAGHRKSSAAAAAGLRPPGAAAQGSE